MLGIPLLLGFSAQAAASAVGCAGVDKADHALKVTLSADRARLSVQRGEEKPTEARVVEVQDWSVGERYVTRRNGYLEFGADSTIYVYHGEALALTCD